MMVFPFNKTMQLKITLHRGYQILSFVTLLTLFGSCYAVECFTPDFIHILII